MIKFILKFINSNETREVFMDEQTFSEYSDGINKENTEGGCFCVQGATRTGYG